MYTQKYLNKLNRRLSIVITFSLLYYMGKAQVQFKYDADGDRTQSLSIGSARAIRPSQNDSTNKPDIQAMRTAMENGISVFPNPAHNSINVTVTKFDSAKYANIYLMDMQGNILYNKQVTSIPVPIDVSNLASGMYIVKVEVGKTQLYYRVLKN